MVDFLRDSGVPPMPAGIGFVEVSDVAVYGVNHVAFAACDDSWILGSDVIQELFQSCHCLGRRFCLLRCKCAEGSKYGAVDPTSVPKECTKDLLEVLLLCFVNWR